MKKPKSLAEFNKLREGQKVRWIEYISPNTGGPNTVGVVVDKHADIVITFQRINWKITKLFAAKWSDLYQKAERETLAEMAMQNRN